MLILHVVVADYVDGDICGHVEERDKDGNILFKGEFWYDLRHGPGICYYPVILTSLTLS